MGTHPIFESDFDCLTDMPRIVESRFKQAAEAKKTRVVGKGESEAKTKTKLSTTAVNESSFSASRLGLPMTSSTPAPRKIASKIASKENVSKNVSKTINKTNVKPVDRTTNEKMRAESARLKSEKSAKKLSDLIEKVKIKHLAATKIKLNNVHLDIERSKHRQEKIKERITKLESDMEKHLEITCDAEAFFELKAERESKIQKLEALMPHFDAILIRMKEASPYLPIIQNSMIIELRNTSVEDLLRDMNKLDDSLVRLFNTKSEDEILEDLNSMEQVKLAEVRIEQLKNLLDSLKCEITRMKREIALLNYSPDEMLSKNLQMILKPF